MMDIDTLKKIYESKKESFLSDFFTFLRFPTVATDNAYLKDVEKCADWLLAYLSESGLVVEKWQGEKTPTIFASYHAGIDKETLLIYCHYDVQPVDPLQEWLSPPFEPVIRDGNIYARGAQDNKGQCFYTIAAIKTLLKERGNLPVNLKLIIEGEEESGSTSLAKILEEKKEALRADYLLIVDSGILAEDQPAITLGARGIVCMEVTVQEASFDLHSGMVGGIAYNPNRALAEMLAKLHDSSGSVAVPGFYDEVVEMSPQEKKEISFSWNNETFQKLFGFEPTGMEKGVGPEESCWLRPTLEINGIHGGYTGSGFKTVIPAFAQAKISCRLVPRQKPDQIARLVASYLEQQAPKGMKVQVNVFPGNGEGFRTTPSSRIVSIMSESYSAVFEKECQKILIGGSIPISVSLAESAKAQMVLVGVGLPGDRIHAPNEHFSLSRLEKGFLTICRGIELFE